MQLWKGGRVRAGIMSAMRTPRHHCLPRVARFPVRIVLAFVATVAAGGVGVNHAAAGDEPIVATDLLRIRTIESIDVARDGTKAVFSLKSIAETASDGGGADIDDGKSARPAYEYRSHLYLLDLDDRDATPVQLTFGRRSDRSPRLSPDGHAVAFVRSDPGGGHGEHDDSSQVWLLPLTGGEARPLTDFAHGAGSPVWSPVGNSIVVQSSIPLGDLEDVPAWPLERPQRTWNDAARPDLDSTFEPAPDGTRAEIRAWLADNAEEHNPNVITRLDFQGERALREGYDFSHLFLVDASAEKPVAAKDATRLTEGAYDHRQAAFMPDGRSVVYVAKKIEDEHSDRVRESDLWIVDVDGSNARPILSRDGWRFNSPRPSLDGTVVAFTARQLDEPMYRQTRLGLAPVRGDAEGKEPIWLTDALDASVRSFEWMSARGSILFNTAIEGSFPLMTISPGLLEPALVYGGDAGVHEFGVGGGTTVFTVTRPENPCVLMVSQPGEQDRVAFNPNEWVFDKKLSFPEQGWLERPDGTSVQYWIMPPTNLREGETYPLALEIHGGPTAMWGPGEATMWHEFQLLCAWGYGVVYCNPRGSGGYGYEFQKANHQNWGEGPAGDVLAAVDRALRKPWVDQERLVVTGGSYAGYLTAWIVGHDHRFKAAVAQRGVYELTTFFGEGNAWRLVDWAMGGWPWQSNIRPILQRESPFTHVRRIRTPLLIMHASQDLRTGVSQSEMLYRALKVLEKPVEYIRYPSAGHDLSRTGDPHQRLDRLNRIIEFFERYIDNDRPAPVVTPAASESP